MSAVGRGRNVLVKALDLITATCRYAGTLMLLLIASAYLIEVFSRYFLNAPTRWASDVVGYALLASVFLLLPWVTAQRMHVAVTFLPDRLAPRAKLQLERVVQLIGVVVCGLAAYYSLNENIRQYTSGSLTIGNEPIPKWTISIFITIGLAATALHFLRFFISPEAAPDAQPTEI